MGRFLGNLMKPNCRQLSWALHSIRICYIASLFISLSLELHSLLSAPLCTSSLISSWVPLSLQSSPSLKLHDFGLHPAWVMCLPLTHAAVPTSDLQQPLCLSTNYLGKFLVLGQPVGWLALKQFYSLLLKGKVTWLEAIDWSGVSEKGRGRGTKMDWLLKLEQNHSFVVCLSGPLQLGGMWMAEAMNSQFSKPSVSRRVWCRPWPSTNPSSFIASPASVSFSPAKEPHT